MATQQPSEQAPPGEADPAVWRAFALGWEVSDLHRDAAGRRDEPAAARAPRLPGLGELSAAGRTLLGITQIDARLHALADRFAAASVPPPATTALHDAFEHGGRDEVRAALAAVHEDLLVRLTATDFRLGNGYALGRALGDTCAPPPTLDVLVRDLAPARMSTLRGALADLTSAFPPHAGRAVVISLDHWEAWGARPAFAGGAVDWAQHGVEVQRAVTRQGQLWRALLSGEKAGREMLDADDYLTGADQALKRLRAMMLRAARQFPLALAAILLALAGLIAIAVIGVGSATAIAAVTAALGVFGLTWSTLGQAVKRIAAQLQTPLWGAELDYAIAAAITRLPGASPADVTIEVERRRPVPASGPQAALTPEERRAGAVSAPASCRRARGVASMGPWTGPRPSSRSPTTARPSRAGRASPGCARSRASSSARWRSSCAARSA